MYEPLSYDEMYAIHVAASEILERVGIMIQHDRALEMLEEAGATVNKKTKVAKIPEYLVKDMLNRVPSRDLLCARNPDYNVLIGDGTSYFTNAFGAHYTIDLETGERRLATVQDLDEFTLLSDYFSTVDYVKPNIMPQEVSQDILQQVMALSMFKNTEKHCSVFALTPTGFRDVIEMAKILAGGEDEFIENPSIIDTGFNNVPPLKYTGEIIDMVLECAKYRIPFDISTGALASASGPVTLAGMIAQGIAENQAVVVVAQLAGPGTPIMWGSCGTILDQRRGTAAYGSPENGLIHAAFAQMARYYGLPYYGAAGVIDSKAVDPQAAYENMMNALIAALAGADVIHDGVYGILEAGVTASYEMFAISHDICSAIKRVAEGFRVTKETLAVDIIEAIGHGKNHLTSDEGLEFTQKHVREEQWHPLLTDRSSRPDWEARGSKDMVQRAHEKIKEILDTHEVEPLDKDTEEKMKQIVKKAKKG
jgi:trimethylamine--corrinoid protein Co-methyltransferase